MNARVNHARDLKPGQGVVLCSGAYYPAVRAVVLGHQQTRWGHHVELTVERRDPETGEVSFHRETVQGEPTWQGIGWQPAGDERSGNVAHDLDWTGP